MIALIDAHYMLHRAAHVKELSILRSSWGASTGGALGVLRGIHDTLDRFPLCDRVVLVFDGGISQRRRKIYPNYKVREAVDVAEHAAYMTMFRENRDLLQSLAPTLGVRSVELKHREADDLIGLLATKAENQGELVVIVSDDKDMYQLVSRNIWVYRPMAQQVVRIDTFPGVTGGITWGHWLLYRATTGDASDRIPGIEGVGEKTAHTAVTSVAGANLCEAYRLFCNTSADKRIRKIADNWDVVTRNMQLMEISQEKFEPAEAQQACVQSMGGERAAVRIEDLMSLLVAYECQSLIEQLPGWLIPFQRLR